MAIHDSNQSTNAVTNGDSGNEAAAGATATKEDEKIAAASSSIPAEVMTVKHPLQYSWTLWYYKNDRSKSWQENLREVVTFSTVEDFWAVYNHIQLASNLGAGSDYNVFKQGVKPMWEDERNKNGGRWLINLDKKMRASALDNAWLEILLCLIGESFGDDECNAIVNGAVVSIRNKGDKIGVWLGDAKRAPAITAIGRALKARMGLGPQTMLGFEVHEDTMHKSGSTAKNRFTI